jgi:hypothetical protein
MLYGKASTAKKDMRLSIGWPPSEIYWPTSKLPWLRLIHRFPVLNQNPDRAVLRVELCLLLFAPECLLVYRLQRVFMDHTSTGA